MLLQLNIQLFGGSGNYSSSSSNSSFSESDENAIADYVSGEGMDLNNFLRERYGMKPSDMNKSELARVNALDKALNKKLPEQILFRSVDASAVFGNMSTLEYTNLVEAMIGGPNKFNQKAYNQAMNSVGKTFTDKGFVSTSKMASVAEEWGNFSGSEKPIVMRIKTSKSTKGRDVSKIGDKYGDAQHEVLLGRGQKYKIKKVSYQRGNIYVDVDV